MTNARILFMRQAEKTEDPMDPRLAGWLRESGQACKHHSRHVRHFQFLIATSMRVHCVLASRQHPLDSTCVRREAWQVS